MMDAMHVVHAFGMLAVFAATVAVTMALEPWRTDREEPE